MKAYFPLLDILRFFAAFWVMGFHYFLGFSGELSWYRYGNLGVPLFFIISGFVISQSIAHASTKAFVLGRFIRLFPLFWIICSLTYIFTLLMPNGNPVQFPEYFISMTMLGEYLANALGYTRIVDAAYWSLVVELFFYAGIGFFVFLFSWERIRWFTALWFAIVVTIFALGLEGELFAKMLLARHASYFLFGITLMLVVSTTYSSMKQKLYDYGFLVLVALWGTYISYRALPPYLTPHPSDTFNVTILQLVFFVGTALLVYLSRYLQNARMITYAITIGGLTYPLYLLHQTIGNTLIAYFESYGSLFMRGTIMMVTMIAFAYMMYRFDKRLRHKLTSKLLPSKKSSP